MAFSLDSIGRLMSYSAAAGNRYRSQFVGIECNLAHRTLTVRGKMTDYAISTELMFADRHDRVLFEWLLA